jgi:hypothetical protein
VRACTLTQCIYKPALPFTSGQCTVSNSLYCTQQLTEAYKADVIRMLQCPAAAVAAAAAAVVTVTAAATLARLCACSYSCKDLQ